MLRLPQQCKMQHRKVVRLKGENDALALTSCACHAKRKRNLNACHKTQQKRAICEKIDLQHVIQITLCERRPMVRLSDLVRAPCEDVRTCCERLRSLEQCWANTTPTSRPPESNENPSLRIREKLKRPLQCEE